MLAVFDFTVYWISKYYDSIWFALEKDEVVVDGYQHVKKVGFEKHLEEEEERSKAEVDLMGHLERKCYKAVKLEG